MVALDAGVNSDGTNAQDSADRNMVVYVTATDPSGAETEQKVTITVKDINDAPEFRKDNNGHGRCGRNC